MGRSLRIGRFVACQKIFVESRLRVGTKSPLLIGRDNGRRLFDYLLRLVRVSFQRFDRWLEIAWFLA
jgi:hypothetical protein